MESVEEMYKGSFFAPRHKLSWRIPHVCNAVCKVLNPSSLVDVGCGIGDYVHGFIMNGVDAFGIEGSKNCIPYLAVPKDKIFIKDIRELIRETIGIGLYDMILCLEVLEHIEHEFAETIIYNFSNMSNKILTSAAPPGQKGHYHVNCRPKKYWERRFLKYGYQRDKKIEDKIKSEWKLIKSKKGMNAYYANLMYYEKK